MKSVLICLKFWAFRVVYVSRFGHVHAGGRLRLHINVTSAVPLGIGVGIGAGVGFGAGLLAFNALVREGDLVLTVDLESGVSTSSCKQLR